MVFNTTVAVITKKEDRLRDVIVLSVSFMMVFTAFITMCNIEQTVLKSITADDPTFTGDGYISLAIIYTVFSISNWIAPSIIAVLNAKIVMIIGAVLYNAFIASFLYPQTWLLYFMSGVLGIAAAVLWTAQGNYLTYLGSKETVSRNSGLFWAILQCSAFFGNGFVFWMFQGKIHIDSYTRTLVFSVLTGVGTAGVLSLFLLPYPRVRTVEGQANKETGGKGKLSEALSALVNSLKMLTQKNMLLLFVTFIYSGFELSFYSGVYSTSVGNTELFGSDAKRLVGLSGVFIGAGGVVGGTIFTFSGAKLARFGRTPVIVLGVLAHISAFIMIYINLPDASPLRSTSDSSYLTTPLATIAMLCAFIMGFGDSCFNTQIYSILGELYTNSEDSSSSFALFKFSQSAAAAAAFFSSSALTLRAYLIILTVVCVLGGISFIMVESGSSKKSKNSSNDAEGSIETENEEEHKLKADIS